VQTIESRRTLNIIDCQSVIVELQQNGKRMRGEGRRERRRFLDAFDSGVGFEDVLGGGVGVGVEGVELLILAINLGAEGL